MARYSHNLRGASVLLVASLLIGCQSGPPGFANNSDGWDAYYRFCTAVTSFVRAPVDTNGLRRAWFLPFRADDQSIDFYAPMMADPNDDLAYAFYKEGGAQLTHYVLPPMYAETFSSCLTREMGFKRVVWRHGRNHFYAKLEEASSGSQVVVRATGDTTAILIASEIWNGDTDQALSIDRTKKEGPGAAPPN